MRTIVALAIAVLLAIPVLASASNGRAESVDIGGSFGVPLENGDYPTEDGMVFNLTLKNFGSTDANLTGSVQLEVKKKGSDTLLWKPLSRSFKNVPKAGEIYMQWPRWTPSNGGDFQAKAYITYFGDTYVKNNEAIRNFSMHSVNWTEDPKLEDGKVSPVFGTTSTDFVYSVLYTYNKLPDIVKVRIDGIDHTMEEEDPTDVIGEDGKKYVHIENLPVGDHDFNFTAKYGNLTAKYTNRVEDPQTKKMVDRPFRGPWVNITLNTETMSPLEGYMTTAFRFSVFYGSALNLPPDAINAVINGKTYNLTRDSISPIYTSGQIEYYVKVVGYDLGVPPVVLTFNCRQGYDSLSLGPFIFKGPSMKRGNLTGNVTDISGSPVRGALVSMEPGKGMATTSENGSYRIETFEGFGYRVTCSSPGLLGKTYVNVDIAPGADKRLDFILSSPPIGASISGSVFREIEGIRTPVGGVTVSLVGSSYSNSTVTNGTGHYMMGSIPGGEGYELSVMEDAYNPFVSMRFWVTFYCSINYTLNIRESFTFTI